MPSTISIDTLLQRIASGELPAHIAADIGVNRATITKRLANHPDYANAKRQGIAVRMQAIGNFARMRDKQLIRLHARRGSPQDYPELRKLDDVAKRDPHLLVWRKPKR